MTQSGRGGGSGSLTLTFDPTGIENEPLKELDSESPWLDDPDFEWVPADGDPIDAPPPSWIGQPGTTINFDDVPPITAGVNLIKHSMFETATDWAVGSGWTVPYETTDAFYGSNVARALCSGAGGELASVPAITIDPDLPYWVAFQSRMPSYVHGEGVVVLREYDSDLALIHETPIARVTGQSDVWTRYSQRFATRKLQPTDILWQFDTAYARLAFVPSDSPDFEWWVDAPWFAAGDLDGQYHPRPGEDIHGSEVLDRSLPDTAFAEGIDPVLVVDALPSAAQYIHRLVILTTDHKLYQSDGTTWTRVIQEPDLTALPTGIETVSDLPSLPNPSYMPGTFVYLSTDGKLYRNVSTGGVEAWTAAVDPVDVTGLAAYVTAHGGIASVGTLPSPMPDAAYPQGVVVFLTTDNKLYRSTGSAWTAEVPTVDLTGTIGTTQIAASAVTHAKLAVDSVQADVILAATITTTQIADNAITTPLLSAGAVTAAKVATDTLTANEIAAGAIATSELAANAVTAAKIVAGTITTTEIASSTILAGNIAANTITASQIAADTITAGQIAASAITTSELAALSVTAAKIVAGTITANEIASATITGDRLVAGTITASQIAAGTITTTQIAATTILAGNIAAGTITATQIATDTITAGQIAAGAVSTSELAANAITAAKIAAGAITTDRLTIGNFDQLVANAGFETGVASDWTLATNHVVGTTTPRSGVYSLVCTATGRSASNALYCAAGDTFYAEVYARRTGGSGATTARVNIAWYDSASALISRTSGTTTALTTSYALLTVGGTGANAAAPANTMFARVEVEVVATDATNVLFDDAYSRRTLTGSIVVDGTITGTSIAATTITASNIATDTITASQIAANAITTTELNALAVTAAKIAANTITASQIAAGTITATELAANTITTAKLAVTASVGYVDNSIGGTVTYGVTISPTGIAITDKGGASVLTGAGFTGSWLTFITNHAYNSAFDSGPNGSTATIITNGATSTLPNFTDVVVGGTGRGTGTSIQWLGTGAVGRGGILRFRLINSPGTAADDEYVYTDVPIAPVQDGNRQGIAVVSYGAITGAGASSGNIYIKAQYLKADGTTTTGTETTTDMGSGLGLTVGNTQLSVRPNNGVQPTDAAFVRVKFGIARASAGNTQTAIWDLYGFKVDVVEDRMLISGPGASKAALIANSANAYGTTHGVLTLSGTIDSLLQQDGWAEGGVAQIDVGYDATQVFAPLVFWDNGSDPTGSTEHSTGAGIFAKANGSLYDLWYKSTNSSGTWNAGSSHKISGTMAAQDTDGLIVQQNTAAIWQSTVSGFVTHTSYVASTAGAILNLRHSRGASIGTNTAVQAAGPDTLGSVQFSGYDGSGYQIAAAIYGLVDAAGNVTSGTTVDGRLSFRTMLAGTLTEQWYIGRGGTLVAIDGNHMQFGGTTGTKIGTATTQKIGFWNTTPVTQAALAPTTVVAVSAAGATNTWFRNTTSAGGLGGNAYTVGDIVFALKTVGILP